MDNNNITQGQSNVTYLQSLRPKCTSCNQPMVFEVESGIFVCLEPDCEDD
jgi:predicted RNA-binding Zn-ribbon protein involved in translation (DUF1610 family)